MGSSALPLILLLMSLIHSGLTEENGSESMQETTSKMTSEPNQQTESGNIASEDSPTPTLTVTPNTTVFTGERVSLKCEINSDHSDWRYEWYKGTNSEMLKVPPYTVNGDTLSIQQIKTSDQDQYWCKGERDGKSSQSNSVSLSVMDLPTPTLTVTPDGPVFTGETVNLKCEIKSNHRNWRYEWYKGSKDNNVTLKKPEHHTGDTLSIQQTATSDKGQYWCKGLIDGRSVSSQSSSAVSLSVEDLPTPTLTVTPDGPVFTGERVNLKCEINSDHSNWRYEWYKGSKNNNVMLKKPEHHTGDTLSIQQTATSDKGQYWCKGHINGRSVSSQLSSAVSLSVKDLPTPTLTVTPDGPVFTGERVNLKCEINSDHSNWRYEWYKGSKNNNVMLKKPEHHTGDTLSIQQTATSDKGQYWCKGHINGRSVSSQLSSAVSLSVKDLPTPTLTVTPDGPVFTGERVNLKCEINSDHSNWRYEWYKGSKNNNVMLKKPEHHTGDTLSIQQTATSDKGQYWCKGHINGRSVSSQLSSAVSLSVKDLPTPTLTVTPDGPVFTGERVNLKCEINSDHSNWRYEWYKGSKNNNVMLKKPEHHTGDTLSIQQTATSDKGQYWCKGHINGRSVSSQLSSAVSLSVEGLPTSTLTVTPDKSVFTGETVNLKCVINSDHSDWRYEWYKGYSVLQTSVRYTVNGDTLSIVGAVKSDQGQYTCKGHIHGRSVSSRSSSVSLSVKDKPKPNLTVKPQSSVFTGDTVTLSCDVGQSTGWTFLWRKDSNRESIDHSTKTISSVRVSDGGTYQCRAERGKYYTKLSDKIKITVRERPKPVVRVQPDVRVFRGETVTLTCDIQEAGVWRYNWYKDHYSTGQDQIYKITSVDQSHAGVYSCRGTQTEAPQYSEFSDGVTLTVSDLPTSTLTVTPDSPVFTGETVNLKCVINSDHSDWRYEWNKDYSVLQTSERYTVNRDTLSIVEAVTSDQGWYWCRGQRDGRPNSSQSRSVSLSVSVTDSPTSTLTVTPDRSVFTGETVNLKCVIETYSNWIWRNGLTYDWRNDWTHDWTHKWRYEWYKGSRYSVLQTSERHTVNGDTLTISGATESYQGQYWCRGQRGGRPNSSHSSSVSLSVKGLKPKPELTSDPAGAALTGNTVTLTCRMDPSTGYWDFYWYKHTLNPETEKRETNSYRLKTDSVSDGGHYWCRAGRGKPVYYTNYSDALWVNVTESPKAVLTVRPDERVFRGETVTLRCEIKWGGDTEWTYRWEINGTNNLNINSANRCTKQECGTSGVNQQKHREAVSLCSTQELNISSVDHFHSGKYTCTGLMNTQSCQRSDAVTLTVSAEAQAAVRVSPQPWLTEGESVTLICEVSGSSTGWTFSWFRDHDHLSDSSRGAGGSYILSPAALQHTGVYTCRAERGRPAYYTRHSSTQPLWVTGVSASVSLVINPSRSQHFSSDSLSLSCEDQSNSAGWTVRRYTDKDTKNCSTQTGSACVIESLSTSDTGVYWCQSESGEKRHPQNITVHDGEVILVSSVDPVIEGETLTLHCLHRSTNSSILSADFYKDGSLVQNQTTGEMSITTVSKSHEGFYYCKTERGQSLHSWISVRAPQSSSLLVIGVSVGLSFFLLFLVSLVLLWRHKNNKDHHRNTQHTSVPTRSGDMENSPLQPGSDHIYDDVTPMNKRDKAGSDHIYNNATPLNKRDKEPLEDVTYSEVSVKKNIPVDKDDTTADPNNVMYSEVGTKVKKFKSKDINTAGPSDLTYAQINIQDKKKSKGKGAGLGDVLIEMKSKEKYKGKSSESGDTLYSELNHNTDRGADAEVSDATYAQVLKKKGHKNK
ncbi:basement membrane-specific heparan sulfate proteoglycan core protein-like isoform X5 [Ctenopharyngodon idella]|uniref:basement membrane-specific heparan sulfate proteoglycan core protein-like isoform X4 n=2 Tax=Ctenopharyngodon idella TaxID=7959 RepID=UPI002230A324|nr:basement membrane-specific heparan sulfate proteoglycan core protein-like isoform X4 [Ctenopharyngodon idella]XP_051756745.1 basement membrane-specific heparan sulfate proteoglycan core protein-like isoform X4 [Ctenopharyngodon idella]XP_051756746.1 basement membrane-specific heparan sulfate proteoglycan core protein-like isoform X4 [Ctenopharyngodon idella]XP_051756747.1 basement membrane-specific heparan sulfate proteoglycan core protein-like isoform X5 [Ctenopharyngodon idella]